MKPAGPYASGGLKASDGIDAPPGVLLPHLAGSGARLRQAMAADLVRGCPHIVEIGGAGLPITGFLTHGPESVTVVDPKIPAFEAGLLRGAPCRVRHLPAKLQDADIAVAGEFALVLLGLSLKPFGSRAALSPELLALASAARTLVVDYALDLGRAQEQIGPLLSARDGAPEIDVAFEIRDPALEAAGFARRRLVAFGVSAPAPSSAAGR